MEQELQDKDQDHIDEPLLALTDKAVEMLKQAMEEAGRKETGIRMTVAGGGCEGFQYSLKMETETRPDDVVVAQGGIKALLDPVSAQRLQGTLLDYVTNRYGTGFHFFGLDALSVLLVAAHPSCYVVAWPGTPERGGVSRAPSGLY